jgi:diphosphomevalonate decarboxylase
MSQQATAIARANIALAKYWGKSDVKLNLPAVASISLTLEPMRTETTVTFDAKLPDDELVLNGKLSDGKPRMRAIKVLDQVRAIAGIGVKARVESANNFPTASGLA